MLTGGQLFEQLDGKLRLRRLLRSVVSTNNGLHVQSLNASLVEPVAQHCHVSMYIVDLM